MPQVNRVCLSVILSECASANESKKAGQVPSIYDWRLWNEESIYYGSPLVIYAYLYVCEESNREREKKGGGWGVEHHHLYGSSISLSASVTT